jgi:hypothetical protein
MTDLFCLTNKAKKVLKEPGIKLKVMYVLGINDPRTIEKHAKNNFPNNPLLNYNVLQIIKNDAPHLEESEICHKLSKDEIQLARKKCKELKERNSKYNNLKNQGT